MSCSLVFEDHDLPTLLLGEAMMRATIPHLQHRRLFRAKTRHPCTTQGQGCGQSPFSATGGPKNLHWNLTQKPPHCVKNIN